MQNKFCVIKNGLVLTLDKEGNTGYFNVILKGNKIFDIDYSNELSSDELIIRKYPEASIIDASNKLIIPSFLNSHKNSSYFFSKYYLKRSTYDNLKANIPIRLLEKYFSDIKNQNDLLNLFSISFTNSMLNGESFLNETSKFLTAELIKANTLSLLKDKPDMIYTVYDEYISDYYLGINKFHCIGLKEEDDLNNYSLSAIKKALNRGNKRALIEVLQTANSTDLLRNLFGKSFIKVLADNDLLSQYIILSNPVYLAPDEIPLIAERNINIIFCPFDICRLSRKTIEYELFYSKNFNIALGTGIMGNSILKEMKLLYSTSKTANVNAEYFMKMGTVNPSKIFGISNIYGTIEKNKIANLLMFDLSDIRNFLNIPEIDSEKVSEFILENLEEKDISDIIFRGEIVTRNFENQMFDINEIWNSSKYLSAKIFEVGRYFEFKQKSLMRERVREFSLGLESNTPPVNYIPQLSSEEDLYSDNAPDSEFRIIGVQKSDSPISGAQDSDISNEEQNWLKDISNNINEIRDFDSGFDLDYLYSDYDLKIQTQNSLDSGMSQETLKMKANSPTRKIFLDDATGESISEDIQSQRDNPDTSKNIVQTKSRIFKEADKVVFKKEKLKFGFDEEDRE